MQRPTPRDSIDFVQFFHDANLIEKKLEEVTRFLEEYMLPGGIELVPPHTVSLTRTKAKIAEKSFGIATDRDLVYVVDQHKFELFMQLWKRPWCKKIERLAIRVGNNRVAPWVKWDADSIDEQAEALWPEQENRVSAFLGAKLKEILLVLQVGDGKSDPLIKCPLCMYPRDAFGFIDYERFYHHANKKTIRSGEYISNEEHERTTQLFRDLDRELRSLISDKLDHELTIRYVVEVDCQLIRDDPAHISHPIYERTKRK